MANKGTLTTIALAAALLAPAAAATWTSYGDVEPDTVYDVPTLMWTTPPGTDNGRVYFNVFAQYGENVGTNGGAVNPNVGVLDSRLDPPGARTFEAIFGMWTDCNGDGYIGMLETAVREYDARLLLGDDQLCPLTPLSQTNLPTRWNGANNYNNWVTELIPIAGHHTSDLRVIKDPGAMVWGDPGLKDAAFAVPTSAGCSLQPVQNKDQREQGYTVGRLLWEADCRGERTLAGESVSALDAWDAGLSIAGLGWGTDPANSTAPQNRNLGSDRSEYSAVSLQDCNAEPLFSTGTAPPGSDADNRTIQPLPSNPVNPDTNSWTVPGTLNRTTEEQPLGTRDPPGSSTAPNGCNYDDDEGQNFYGPLEANPDVPPIDGKNRATWNFAFGAAGQRGSLPVTPIRSGSGGGASTDAGIDALGIGCTNSVCAQSAWIGPTFTYLPCNPATTGTCSPTTRGDLTQGQVAIDEADYFTFYAKWNMSELNEGDVLAGRNIEHPGGSGIYGQDQCGTATHTDPVAHKGWNCDRADWYLQADGTYEPPAQSNFTYINAFARVGDAYQFRDVDCYDGDVGGGLGVGLSAAYYGNGRCAPYGATP